LEALAIPAENKTVICCSWRQRADDVDALDGFRSLILLEAEFGVAVAPRFRRRVAEIFLALSSFRRECELGDISVET